MVISESWHPVIVEKSPCCAKFGIIRLQCFQAQFSLRVSWKRESHVFCILKQESLANTNVKRATAVHV